MTAGQQHGAARSQFQVEQAIHRAFFAALMLTANSARAEHVVSETINSLEVDDITGEGFSLCVLTLAVANAGHTVEQKDEVEDVFLSNLPLELNSVLALPTALRHCFVLRTLLGLPEQTCLWLLQVEADILSNRIADAALALAKLCALTYSSVALSGRDATNN